MAPCLKIALMLTMMRRLLTTGLLYLLAVTVFAQSPEFNEPWKNPNVALAIDPFEGNAIDWAKLATDKRVVAIIHRATIGDRVDKKYAERKIEAKKRGYKWGAYHYGKPGDPIKQADFFLATVKPEPDDLLALDLESTDFDKHMSFEEARVFINRIKEKTGRYTIVYANNLVTRAIGEQVGETDVFAKTHLWYARLEVSLCLPSLRPGSFLASALPAFSGDRHGRCLCMNCGARRKLRQSFEQALAILERDELHGSRPGSLSLYSTGNCIRHGCRCL